MSKSLVSRWVILVFTGATAATTSAQSEFVEIGIGGLSRLSPRHLEFLDTTAMVLHREVERSVFGR